MEKEWYRTWWGVILAIIFLPVTIIWFTWAKTEWSNVVKWGVTVVVAVVFVGTLFTGDPSTPAAPTSTPAPVNTPEPVSEEEVETEIAARVLIFASGITIANQSGKEWLNCKVELNPGLFRGGYTQTLPVLANDASEDGLSPNFMEYSNFTKNGERFNYRETKPENIYIECKDAEGNRGSNIFGNG